LAIPSHANGYFTEVIIQENTWKKEEKKITGENMRKSCCLHFQTVDLQNFQTANFTTFLDRC
jgi:hypothetical protein